MGNPNSLVELKGSGKPATGPRSAGPTKPAVLVLTPSIAFSRAGISSIKTPERDTQAYSILAYV